VAGKNKWVVGRWEITYTPNRTSRVLLIRADGAVLTEKGEDTKQRIKEQKGELILDLGDRMERRTFVGNRVFIEHFWPKSDYERNTPNQVGIGELVKKKK